MKPVYALALAVTILGSPLALAQDVPPASPEAPAVPVEPAEPAAATSAAPPPAPITVSPDPAIFKRTPVMDGQIEPGEWDTYYSFDVGDLHATTYIDWDDANLYVASKTSAPTDLLITLDANGDGWFHGSDNYELVVKRGEGTGGPSLLVSRYESQGTTAGGAPLGAADASAFTMKAGSAPDSYVYELAIPRSTAGLTLKPARKIGIKIAVGAGSPDVQWIPPAPLGEVQSAELVAVKSSASAPLEVAVQLRDTRVTPGQELVAKISVKSKGNVASTADSIVIGGEGKTAKLLGSQLVRLDGVQPGRSFNLTFRTPVSRSATPGSGALGVEVRSGQDRVASSLVSFDIAPAYEVRLDLGTQPVQPGRFHRIAVLVRNNAHREAYGKVKLSLPDGWKYRWSRNVKKFNISQEDMEEPVVFHVKPAAGTEGRVPVLAEVQVGEGSVSASGVLEVK